MNREETLQVFENMLELYCFNEQELDAIDNVMEMLEHEPCEDAIRRDAVCNIVDDIRDCISVEGYWAIHERLKKLPPVNPQPKIGEWEEDGYCLSDNWIFTGWKCNVCGKYALEDRYGRYFKSDYCPKCGAKMVEPQESEVDNG